MFLNRPERPYLAGEISECYCSQFKYSDHQKVVFVINPCAIQYGVYHLSIKTRLTAYNAFEVSTNFINFHFVLTFFKSQYTLKAFVRSPRHPSFKLDFPTDYSAFLTQRSDFHFTIPQAMITGKSSTNTTLKVSLATQLNDTAVVALHKGSTALCGCYNAIAKCSTKEDRVVGQRPYCEFEVDWCKLAQYGPGDYFLTVYPEQATDSLNPIPFTVFAGVKNPNANAVALTPSNGCGSQPKRFLSAVHRSVQHFRVTPQRSLTETDVMEVYVSDIKNGNLQIFVNSGGYATPQCRFAEPIRCAPAGDKNCVVRLTCAKQIDYISVKVEADRANIPVEYSVSSCIASFSTLELGGVGPTVQVPAGGSQSWVVNFRQIAESQVPTLLAKLQPTQTDIPLTVTLSQGRCSACTDFVREIKCTGGACWLAVHFWQLPKNWAVTNWYVQVDNNDATRQVELFPQVSVSPAAIGGPFPSSTAGTSLTVTLNPGTWTVVDWLIGDKEASRDIGIAAGKVSVGITGPSPVPAVQSSHRVMFAVTNKLFTPDVNPTLLPPAGGAGTSDSGVYDVSACCLSPGRWYTYIWNGHPTSSWTISVSPTINLITVHTEGAMEVATPVNVPRGGAVANVFVDFPGYPPALTGPGTSLLLSVIPTDGLNFGTTIYTNLNKPAGPPSASGCTSSLTSSPTQILYRAFYSCEAAPLDASVYWIGISSPSADRTYEVRMQTALASSFNIRPVADNIWISNLQTPIGVLHQSRVDIMDIHRDYSISLTAEVEITDGTGDVVMYWNPDSAAGPNSASTPCLRSVSSANAVRTEAGVSTIGSITLPRCLSGIQALYVGTATVSGNPTHRVRIASKNLFPLDQTRTLTLSAPTTSVSDAGPAKQHLFNFELPDATAVPTNYIRFIVSNIKWSGAPGTVSIKWGKTGTCNFISDTTCNKAGDTCVTIAYPCQIASLSGFSYHVALSEVGNYTATVQLDGSEQQISAIKIGEERQVLLKKDTLRFFRVDLRNSISELGPADNLVIKLTTVTCGTATAWINRGTGASPTCNLNSVGANTCSSGDCTLFQMSACDLMTRDLGGIYYVTVRGLDQFDIVGDIKVRLSVAIVKSSLSNTTITTFLGTEEHRLYARSYDLLTSNPVTEALNKNKQCTPEVLPQFASCCGVKAEENVTKAWIADDVHFEYVVTGGHHLGYGIRIDVGVMREVASATVTFTVDYPHFCGASRFTRNTTCTATPARPCSYFLDTCAHSTRQLWVWINPDSVKWVAGTRGPTVASGDSTYEVAWIRPTRKEYNLFEITPLAPGVTQYHPFWLLPGELEFIQIAHPENYERVTNYHVHISAEKVSGGAVEIVQEAAWTPCTTGECVIRECQSVVDEDECTQNASPCRCENLNRLFIPPCFDPASKLREQFDDDKADHIVVKAIGTSGSNVPVSGRLKITFWEKEERLQKDRCEIVTTGKSRFFIPNGTLGVNQVYKFTLQDMEQDAGGIRLSLNEGKIALPRVSCAESRFCTTNGDSCTLWYRGSSKTTPRITATGESSGIPGNHYFYLTSTIVTVDVVTLTAGKAAISPVIRVGTDNCTKPVAPQYYKYESKGTGDFISVLIVAPGARAWIHTGHVTHGWGQWECDGRKTGGVCETIISCAYTKTPLTYYIHVEGSSHEITVFENTAQVVDAKFGTGVTSPKIQVNNPMLSFRLTDLTAPATNDPTRDISITTSGRLLRTWVTLDKPGDSTCRIPQTTITTTPTASGTFVSTIPSCLIPKGLNKTIFVNMAPKLARHGDTSCSDYEFSVSSHFVTQNRGFAADYIFNGYTAGKTYVIKPTVTGVKSRHFVNIGRLNNEDVVVTRVTNTNNIPVAHTLWKANYDNLPRRFEYLISNHLNFCIQFLNSIFRYTTFSKKKLLLPN